LKRKQFFPFIAGIVIILSILTLAGCCKTPQVSLQTQIAQPDAYIPQIPDETTQSAEQQIIKPETKTSNHKSPENSTPDHHTPDQQFENTPDSRQESKMASHTISLDKAIEIAYDDLASRDIDATFRSSSGIDWEKGQWVWELLFNTHGERMPLIEYYINVDDGYIIKFEWDD